MWLSIASQAQFVEGKPLVEIDREFVQIWITQSNSGSMAYLDLGQERKHLYGKNNLTDIEGKDIKTLSHVPLVNQMIAAGYDILAVTSLKNDNVNTILYSFRKEEHKTDYHFSLVFISPIMKA